jgi:hypothetical protein
MLVYFTVYLHMLFTRHSWLTMQDDQMDLRENTLKVAQQVCVEINMLLWTLAAMHIGCHFFQ